MVNRYLNSIYGIYYKDEISGYDLVITDKNGNKFQLKGNKDGIIKNDNNNNDNNDNNDINDDNNKNDKKK